MSSPVRFLVRQQVYTPPNAAGIRRVLPAKYHRAAVFPKADAAHADCAKRLTEFRRATNPFQLGGPCLFYQTSFPPFVLHDYLFDHGIDPPANSLSMNPSYVFWWVKNNRAFTDRQREIVWAACDKLKPFEVIEEDDRKAVQVVVQRPFTDWVGDVGMQYRFTREGGLFRAAFPTVRQARKLVRELDDELRADFGAAQFVIQHNQETEARLLEPEECRFTEVVGVPGEGDWTIGGEVSIVARQSYWDETGGYEMASADGMYNLGARVPLSWAASSSLANDPMKRLVESARQMINPFSLVWPDDFNWYTLSDEDDAEDRLLPSGLTIDDAIEIVRQLPTIPPAPDVPTAEWYDRVVQWSPEFIDIVWSTFADFRLFEVVEVPLGG